MMTPDAKLGLLLGVGLVVAAALVYYRPDPVQANDSASVKAQVGNSRSIQLAPASSRGPAAPRPD
jgi:hypothetical protein